MRGRDLDVLVATILFAQEPERFSRSLFWSSIFPFRDRVGDCVGALETLSTLFGADCRRSCRRFLSRLSRWVGADFFNFLEQFVEVPSSAEIVEVILLCQQLCAHVGSVGFVCLRHLSCVPSC